MDFTFHGAYLFCVKGGNADDQIGYFFFFFTFAFGLAAIFLLFVGFLAFLFAPTNPLIASTVSSYIFETLPLAMRISHRRT